jgi:serine/threonine protein kinase
LSTANSDPAPGAEPSKDAPAPGSDVTLRVEGGTAAIPGQAAFDKTISIRGGTAGVAPGPGLASSLSPELGATSIRKYAVEHEVARGGMGAILRVTDLHIKREVAMKVMISDADPISRIRFIEEARITGRLEHPNIVPVHDLGIDPDGRHYFTMKLVNGRTLSDLLDDVRQHSAHAKTLNQFLNIFTNAAHAVAFAHSRGVVHRDLKPANIMIGDFGEVLVMDWGLAKVKSNVPEVTPHGSGVALTAQTTDTTQTLQGSIIGTPAYMSPEQAKGEINSIDERSDVYSLGAILYEILTLKPPIDGRDIRSLLNAAAAGNITIPEIRAPERKDTMPRELAAISMKALATAPAQRYQTVDKLIADIHLYQEGRSVSAKEDTTWEAAWKLINRNRAVSVVATVALATLLALGIVSYRVNSSARAKAEKSLAKLNEEQRRRREEQKSAAPAFLGRAQITAQSRDFEAALQDVNVALNFDPELAGAHLLKAQLLITTKRYADAIAELDTFLKSGGDADAVQLKELCQQALSKETPAVASAFADIFLKQQAYVFAEGLQLSAEKQLDVFRGIIQKAWPNAGAKLLKDRDGHCSVDLNHAKQIVDLTPLKGIPIYRLLMQETGVKDLKPLEGMPLGILAMEGTGVNDLEPLRGMKLEVINAVGLKDIHDLSPLEGMPIRMLTLTGCRGVRDITPLAGMPLTDVNLTQTRIRDISPLAGLELKKLYLSYTLVTDLSPLKDMPLEGLWLGKTNVMDLNTLKGLRLNTLWLHDSEKISDLSALAGMPLEDLAINGTKVSDLTPLSGMALKTFSFTPKNITKGLPIIRAMSSLREIGINHEQRIQAAEFWKRFDAGEFSN